MKTLMSFILLAVVDTISGVEVGPVVGSEVSVVVIGVVDPST